jgi:hypothetical protein
VGISLEYVLSISWVKIVLASRSRNPQCQEGKSPRNYLKNLGRLSVSEREGEETLKARCHKCYACEPSNPKPSCSGHFVKFKSKLVP